VLRLNVYIVSGCTRPVKLLLFLALAFHLLA